MSEIVKSFAFAQYHDPGPYNLGPSQATALLVSISLFLLSLFLLSLFFIVIIITLSCHNILVQRGRSFLFILQRLIDSFICAARVEP